MVYIFTLDMKKTLAIVAAAPETAPKPRKAAIKATTKNIIE
jgi:hypothetical protein